MKIYLYNLIIFFNLYSIKANIDLINNKEESMSYQDLKSISFINKIKAFYDDLKQNHSEYFNNFKNKKLKNDVLWYSHLLLLTSLFNFKKTAIGGVLLIAYIEYNTLKNNQKK